MIAGRKLLRILVASLLLAPIVLLIVVVIALVAIDEMMCSYSTMQETTSPEGAYTATLLEGSCGATTPMSTHVVIRSAGYGDFLPISNRELRESVLISEGQLKVEFRWPFPTTLLVISHGNKRPGPNHIYAKKDRHGELRIEYQGLQDG